MGKILYCLMYILPSRFLQRSMWWMVRKTGIAKNLSDECFLKLQLLGVTGERYSLGGGGVNSWILWQRLNFKSPLISIGSDKYAVREFVRERIGEKYLIPLVEINGKDYWTDPDEIDISLLPSSFVLKLNNGSGMNMLVKDKSKLDWQSTKETLKSWMVTDYSSYTREWQYKDIKNKIICECFIPTPNGEPPSDYKIMCSNGKPIYLWVDSDRFKHHQRNVFNLEFQEESVQIGFPRGTTSIQKPKNFELMLELAGKLSKGIPVVRVDLYNVEGKVYFGELTFTSCAGLEITKPFEFSRRMARRIKPL